MVKESTGMREMIDEMNNCLKKASSINEAVGMGDGYDNYGYENEEADAEVGMEPEVEPEEEEDPDILGGDAVEDYVAQIRKLTLKGMSELADDHESEQFQLLKKIFMACESVSKKENEEKANK